MLTKKNALWSLVIATLCLVSAGIIVLQAHQAHASPKQTSKECLAGTANLAAADLAGLQQVGVQYSAPTSTPQISCAAAIVSAQNWLGAPLASHATQITARNVVFSDDQYGTTNADGSKTYVFQNVPAWVVTFSGLSIASHSPPGRPTLYDHEENVVINAATRQYMEAFSYR